MKKTLNTIFISLLFIAVQLVHSEETPYILLQSTTSTKNSGLYDYLLPKFKQFSGIDVRVVAVGTGQALRNARNGDADALIVHEKNREQEFVSQGYGIERHELMYNDFILIGPKSDPAAVLETSDVIEALQKISQTQSIFVSRGDDSGTHIKELLLWNMASVDAVKDSGTWYREAGAGMGATLNTAVSMNGYAITDRATWISFGNKQNHVLVLGGDPPLHNQYSIIAVNPTKHPHVKVEMTYIFIDWLLSDQGQQFIADYRVQGEQLFFLNSK
ncbi:MAG: substrate-binding domain-containing protein [Gammaproteobacteria bacterium]|nr:substrate-binding domain-containing protein [Gammaproteobacteria bacterium]